MTPTTSRPELSLIVLMCYLVLYVLQYSDKVKMDYSFKKSTFIFQLEKYIVSALDQDYHTMVRVLSQTSMFDEYLRSRIKSCGMTVLSQSGSIFHLRRRKWQPVTSTTVGYSQHQCFR